MRYEVKALRGRQALSMLRLEGADENDVRAQARGMGYTVISVKEKNEWFGRWGVADFPLVLFSQEMVSLLDAGLSLIEALQTLTEKEQRLDYKNTLARIIALLTEGHSFSYALEQSPQHFPPLFVATVRASERTGALSEVLARFIVYQSQMEGVKRKLISSAIYPALLATVGSLVMLFLMMFVVPRFSAIYADLGGDLPLMSRALMNWGQFLDHHGRLVLATLTLLAAAAVFTVRRPNFRIFLEQKIGLIPGVGSRLRLYHLARFYRSLGMLLKGGMPVVSALELVSGLLQASMRSQLDLAAASIREGGAISRAMDGNGLGTPVALRMLRVGERTGQMGEMMERIAAFYEEETARWVEQFIRLFEPILMTFIGLAIGVIVVLMYFPIFDLAGSIK